MSDYLDQRTREEIGKRVQTSSGRTGEIIGGDFSTGRWTVWHDDDGSTAEYAGPELFAAS